jgi:amidase
VRARALAAAGAADAARAGGEVGPVLGVPMTIKDSIDVAGLPTTWGFPRFKEYVAVAVDAPPSTALTPFREWVT